MLVIKYIKYLIKDYKENPKKLKPVLRYLAVGISCFVCEYFIFILLFHLLGSRVVLGLPPEKVANSIAVFVMFFVSFILNRNWSFESKGNVLKQTIMNLMLFIVNIVFSGWAITELMNMGIHAYIAKILIMGVIVIWNFILYRKVIYRY